MPANTKVPQEIYVWVDDSGITHFSNTIKKETSISVPPVTNSPSPEQAQKQEKPTEQVVQQQIVKPTLQPHTDKPVMQSQVIKPPQAVNGGNVNGFGFMVLMLVMAVALRLVFNTIEKERREKSRHKKIRELRPEANPIPSQKTNDIELAETIRPEPNPMPSRPFWTLEFIRSLEWREFEKLCATVLETRGFCTELGGFGMSGDGGKDIQIYMPQEPERPYAIAQCKAQRQEIKVDTVRAFRGVMAAQNVTKGFFFTSGKFYKKAGEFGKDQQIELVTGDDLLAEITNLPQEKQESLLQDIVSTDYKTPTCTVCGIKMTRRDTQKSEYQFWGCVNFPRCKNKMELRWTDK